MSAAQAPRLHLCSAMPSIHSSAPRFTAFLLAACAAASCGTRTGLLDPPATSPSDAATCRPPAVTCVAPDADPCGAPRVVPADCDAATLTWTCPPGARPFARAPAQPSVCRPFREPGGPVLALGGSLARVPTDDGRCLWVAEDVTLSSGQQLRNVAFEVDAAAPFGACPIRASFAGGVARTAVVIEGDDPSLVAQITGAYRRGGATRVTYRLFRREAGAAFGLRELGTGLGRWDAPSQRIVVPGPGGLRFGTDLDLGDASLVVGEHAYLWGCPELPTFLTERCVVGRIDAADRLELFGGGRWIASARGSDGATVFEAGPWISSVVALPGATRLAHVFAVGFGSDLQVHTAAAPEGPWTSATSLARCDLPTDDADSYCAGPVVHVELADPTRPGELPVTYGVGTTAADQAARAAVRPEAYWPRLQWVRVP
jgi:hypothetical protein